jgi:Protein of unknown function (DUF541)
MPRRPFLVLAVLSLALAGSAEAKVPPASDEPAPPGITIDGVGFARVSPPRPVNESAIERAIAAAKPTAITRAVRDARRRAKSIADALGLELGAADHVELGDPFRLFGLSYCRDDRGRRRCRAPTLTAASATVTFAIVGGADGSAAATISATGLAKRAVRPSDARRNAPIRRALLSARSAAIPAAALAARRSARTAANAARHDLGRIVSVSRFSDPFSVYFQDSALGTFGPGRYCSVVRRRIWKPDPETGRPQPAGFVRRYRCAYEDPYSAELEIVYEVD